MPTVEAPHVERRQAWVEAQRGQCRPDDTPQGFIYYLRVKPTDDLLLPDGWTHYEEYGRKTAVPDFGRLKVYGRVIYNHPLDPYDCWITDLVPADPVHRALIFFISRADGDCEKAARIAWDYVGLGAGRLAGMAKENRYARAALPIARSHDHPLDLLASNL